jgi:hypothetical protein
MDYVRFKGLDIYADTQPSVWVTPGDRCATMRTPLSS